MPLIVVTSASPSAKASPTASASPSPSSSAASCSSIPLSSFVGSTTTRVVPAEVLLQNLLPWPLRCTAASATHCCPPLPSSHRCP
ncbi:unnamed protein product [Closterium sp. NIES-54]